MEESVLIVCIVILCVILFLMGSAWLASYRLKKRIAYQWGKKPQWSRFDKEDSLKEAWLQSKSYQNFDSEIDDITWADLDMYDVFEQINGTYSSVGSESLYQQLRNFNFSDQEATELEALIDFYQENPKTREKLQYYFAQLGKKDNNLVKNYLSSTKEQALPRVYLYILLGILPLLGLLAALFGQVWGIFLALASICVNTIYYLLKKELLERELSSMQYLVATLNCGKQISKLKTPVQEELKNQLQDLKKILTFSISFRSKNYSEADILLDYLNIMFMLPFISYNFSISILSKHHDAAVKVWEILGRLEVAYGVLNFRVYMPITCLPEFRKGGVEGVGTYHPLLAEEAVANPVLWNKNTLVTGSNASGKSTYVKSIAINCILAQSINTATAEKFSLERGDVYSSMAVKDNLAAGDSYFVAEIKSIKRVLDKAQAPMRCYCFIDEILRGTNTIERIAASASVVAWLAEFQALVFVATHDIELTEILRDSCENVHFEEQVTQDDIQFDYKLRPGVSTTRNALALLQVMDYPQEIVDQAVKQANYFEQHHHWRDIEAFVTEKAE